MQHSLLQLQQDTTTTNSLIFPELHPLLDSATKPSQPIEKILTMLRDFGNQTGLNTKDLDHTIKTALFLNPITGRVPNNALNLGNAEEPECAKEEDGAPDTTAAKELPSQIKLQDLQQITDHKLKKM